MKTLACISHQRSQRKRRDARGCWARGPKSRGGMLAACRARFWEHDQQARADRRLQPNGGEKCGLEVRPHFEWIISSPPEQVICRLNAALAQHRDRYAGDIIGTQCHLTVAKPFLHIYSPYLTFEVMTHATGTRLVGRFMPQLAVWSLYITLYGATILVTVALGLFGWVQHSLQLSPWGLWGLPIGLLVLAGLYGTAFVGQSIGAEQMKSIREFVVQAAQPEVATEEIQ